MSQALSNDPRFASGEPLLTGAVYLETFAEALNRAKEAVKLRDISRLMEAVNGLMGVCNDPLFLRSMVLAEASHDLRKLVQPFMTHLYEMIEKDESSELDAIWGLLGSKVPQAEGLFDVVRSSLTEPDFCTEVSVGGHLDSWLSTFAERVLGVGAVSSGSYDRPTWTIKVGPEVERRFKVQLDINARAHTNWPALVRAAINLVGNAADHNPEGPLEVYFTLQEVGESVTLEISDTGKGIEDTEQCFERGFTSNPNGGNSGLGLSIVKRTIEKMGATLQLNGHGTHGGAQFTITMPKHPPTQLECDGDA